MPRNTERKLAQDPSMVHTEVLRDFAGSAQMTSATTGVTFSGSQTGSPTTVTSFKADTEEFVAFESVTAQIPTANFGTTETPISMSITANGSTITSTTNSQTAASITISTTQNTLTTPRNAPTYNVLLAVNGGTATGTFSLSREQRL